MIYNCLYCPLNCSGLSPQCYTVSGLLVHKDLVTVFLEVATCDILLHWALTLGSLQGKRAPTKPYERVKLTQSTYDKLHETSCEVRLMGLLHCPTVRSLRYVSLPPRTLRLRSSERYKSFVKCNKILRPKGRET